MDNPTTIISQNIINVDIDSRAVTLPVNFNLGVMHDNSCKTITFMVQKKSDITDLTDLTFSINTISAKGTPDKIDCDCREEGGFYIITAVLKGTIFEASGKAVFNLCGQKFDSSHVAIKSWGSEDIVALVGSHYHAEKAIEELYPSVLEELKQKANTTDLGVKKVTHTASDTSVTINSGEYHVFPTMASLTITPGTVEADKMFICGFEFTSGSTPTVLTLTGCTLSNSDDVTSGTYEVNILGTSAIVRFR